MKLQKLNFDYSFNFEFNEKNNEYYIKDKIRKIFLKLTPEEWVRQHWIHYFLNVRGYSPSALIIEKKVELNGTTKRIDVLVTEKTIAKILIECKAPNIKITEKIFEQIARYNAVVGAEEIILSNGLQHIFAKFENGQYTFKPVNL